MIKTALPFMVFIFSISATASDLAIENTYRKNSIRYKVQEPKLARSAKISLKAVTLNLGLLKSPSEVPNFDQRSRLLLSQLSAFLESESPDVMFLQEAWDDNPQNIITVRAAAKSQKYISLQSLFENTDSYQSSQARNGLDILIKQSILAQKNGVSDIRFPRISRSLMAAIAGYDRGILHATLTLNNSQTILVATSHFTPNLAMPTYNQDSTRRKQAHQAANILKKAGAETDYVLIGADLNFSPEFEHKINDGRDSDAEDSVWEGSVKSYPIFAEQSLLFDTYSLVNSDIGYTQDRVLNPMSNVSPSTDGEPEQRLDYIWLGSYKRASAIKILSSYLVFNKPLLDQEGEEIQAEVYEGPLFMSDHFGVATKFSLY